MSESKASRGILYVYWGTIDADELERSIASAEKIGLPINVVKLDVVPGSGLAMKAKMYDLSPFDETLFLDTDTLVLDDVMYGFDAASRHGVAIALAPACYVSRGYLPVNSEYPEYNTGVIFFKKSQVTKGLFELWDKISPEFPGNDQTSFSLAAKELEFSPYVLPQNWNFRAHLGVSPIFGPIKVWHTRLAPPGNIAEWNARRPYVFGSLVTKQNGHEIISSESLSREHPFFRKFLRKIKDLF